MTDFIFKIFDIISTGNKKKIIILSLILLITCIVGPFIFKYLYGNTRLLQQVEVLKSLNSFDAEEVSDIRLLNKYNEIVDDFTQSNVESTQVTISFQLPKTFSDLLQPIILIKFISGAFLSFILLIAAITTNQETLKDSITGFVSVFIFMILMGLSGILVPTFDPIIINIVSIPLLQLIIITIFSIKLAKGINRRNDQNERNPNEHKR